MNDEILTPNFNWTFFKGFTLIKYSECENTEILFLIKFIIILYFDEREFN